MFSAYSFVYSCLFVSILRSEHRPHARKSLRAYVKQGIHSDQHRCPCKASRRLVEQAKNKKQTGKHGCHSQAILRARRRQMSAVCSWNAACLFTPHGGTHIHHRSRVHCSKDKCAYIYIYVRYADAELETASKLSPSAPRKLHSTPSLPILSLLFG